METVSIARVLLAVLGLVLFHAAPARAWIFPEHTELTRFGTDQLLPGRLRVLLEGIVAEVRAAGLPICEDLAPSFDMLEKTPCVPYSALPALAGDHSVAAADLEVNLRSGLALRLVRIGSAQWRDFLDHAPLDVRRMYRAAWSEEMMLEAENPHDASSRFLSRRLDLKFAAVDPEYATRAGDTQAHFQNTTATIEVLLNRAARIGDVNNAVAQLMVHHARSMILIAHARKPGVPREQARALAVTALLEHALALHFLQDTFAAGHIGTEPGVGPRVSRKRRHDFLNRSGVSVERAELQRHCRDEDVVTTLVETNVPRCWIAYGDGYLNQLNAEVTARAVAAVQAEFALAANPGYITMLVDACPLFSPDGEAAQDPKIGRRGYRLSARDVAPPCAALIEIVYLLLPFPPHTLSGGGSEALRELIIASIEGRRAEWASAVRTVLDGLRQALLSLASHPIPRAARADARADEQPGVLSPDVLGQPFKVCRPGDPPAGTPRFCNEPDSTVAFGGLDVSLWRPVLVWIAQPRADVRTITGDDAFGYGLAMQVVYGAELGVLVASDVPFQIGPWFGGGASLRVDRLFPSRDNRSLVEANLGLMPTFLAGWGDERYRTQFFGELRIPIVAALVALFAGDELPVDIGPNGARLFFTLPTFAPPDPVGFWGVDVELLNIKLNAASDPRTYAPGIKIDDELRFRLGAMHGPDQGYAIQIGVEVASGHSVFVHEFE